MIRFENDTQNFKVQSSYAYELPTVLTVNILINKNSKRLTIPASIFKRIKLKEKVLFWFNQETNKLFIDFQTMPYNNYGSEELDPCQKLSRVIDTGRGFFTTIPAKWCKDIRPTKAQLIKQPDTFATYEVIFYGIFQ